MSWYTFMPQLFNMSLTAGIAICLVLFLRLLLKNAPKVISYALWCIVLFRLLCPVSIGSGFSLYNLFDVPTENSGSMTSFIEYVPENIVHTEYPSVTLPVPLVSDVINEALPQGREQTVADPLEAPTSIVTYIWMIGVTVMVIYSIDSYIRLRRTLLASVKLHDNIYLADDIASPFVMGLIRPKIYLPSSLSENEREYIILHEQHHIRRGDHIIRLLSFAALCLHWFNPLVWVAFILSGKDMEMSCDEAVLRKLGEDIRADYTASLISLATGRRIIAGTPLAFGEGDTMGRIKNIAKWKKPAVWVIVIAVVVCVVLAICLMTNPVNHPVNRDTMLLGAEYRIAETLYETPSQRSFLADNDLPAFCITADFCLWERDADGEFVFTGQMEPYTLDMDELAQYTSYEEGWYRKYRIGDITDSYILHLPGGKNEGWMYIAFRTSRGDTLLGFGIEDVSERGDLYSDDSEFMWLYRLESVFGGVHLSGEFHERSLAQTVGGDVEIFHTWYNGNYPNYMAVGFRSDDSPYMDGVQLPSPEKTDMGFAVFYCDKEETGYRLIQCHVYEDAALAENGIYNCPDPIVLDIHGERKPARTYDAVLVNNDAAAKITRQYNYPDGSTKTGSELYISGLYMAMFPWDYHADGCTVRQSVYDEQGKVLAETLLTSADLLYGTYTGTQLIAQHGGLSFVPQDGSYYEQIHLNRGRLTVTADDRKLLYDSDVYDTVSFTRSEFVDYLSELYLFDCVNGVMKNKQLWDYTLPNMKSILAIRYYTDETKTETAYSVYCFDGVPAWFAQQNSLRIYTMEPYTGKTEPVSMIPTTVNFTGAFDAYLFVPLDGANYRYERFDGDPASVTKGNLLYTFTEEADPNNVKWRVYEAEDYPDHTVVLAEAGEDYVQLYRYSPPKAVDPALLEQAKEDDKIVLEDGYATSGQAVWNTFYKMSSEGKHVSAEIAHYYTLENGNYDAAYYEVYKEDYPAMYTFDLTYDSNTYTLTWNEYGTEHVRKYKYLRKFEDTTLTQHSAVPPQKVTRYVLTNNNTASWDDLIRGSFSSQLGDYIDHYTIYSELD